MKVLRAACAASLVAGVLFITGGPAQAGYQKRGSVTIAHDDDFIAQNGVRGGSGTKADPYVISGWEMPSLVLRDTGKHVVIRDNSFDRLILNWNGPGLTVVNNAVGDMRVNENVKRTGAPTSGRITNNIFGSVSQLRHFDGVFAKNTVGQAGMTDLPFFDSPVVAFDGFNGAQFRDNVIHGYVNVQLHGHHHGSSYTDTSHHHGAPADAHEGHEGHEMEAVDHTTRFHSVYLTGNKIYSGGYYALRYTDQAHSANDRTASSEQNEALNQPHVHHTKLFITGNQLIGSGLEIDIFNSDDQKHRAPSTGYVAVKNNKISVVRQFDDAFQYKSGITIGRVQDVKLEISGNQVTADNSDADPVSQQLGSNGTGIDLSTFENSRVYVINNFVAGMSTGLSARGFTPTVKWFLEDLRTSGVDQRVAYDESNPPEERP
jgi:hypothetical protein